VSGLRPSPSGEERGLLSRTAAGDRAYSLAQFTLLKIGNKPMYYKSWSSKGIQTVSHLMKDADEFLSFPEFKERFIIIIIIY